MTGTPPASEVPPPAPSPSSSASSSPSSRNRPLALLFDLDGTLVDSIDLLLAAFHHTFDTHLGTSPPDDEWIAGIGTPLVSQLRAYITDDALLAEKLATYRAYQREHHDRLLREFEGARATLAVLKARGHPTALVTSKSNDLAHRALEFVQMDALIDVVVGYDNCARHKPDPEPVLAALRALDYPSDEAVFVGDSPHDIVAGNRAGVVTVAALWGPFKREALEAERPAYVAELIRDLPALVDRIADRPSGGA
jgi:pyrophosphatase PpaX